MATTLTKLNGQRARFASSLTNPIAVPDNGEDKNTWNIKLLNVLSMVDAMAGVALNVPAGPTDPAGGSSAISDLFYNTTTGGASGLKVYTASGWVSVSSGGGSGGTFTNIPTGTADPSGAVAGSLYYNTTSNVLKVYSGSAWAVVGSGGGTTVSLQVSGSATTQTGTADLTAGSAAAVSDAAIVGRAYAAGNTNGILGFSGGTGAAVYGDATIGAATGKGVVGISGSSNGGNFSNNGGAAALVAQTFGTTTNSIAALFSGPVAGASTQPVVRVRTQNSGSTGPVLQLENSSSTAMFQWLQGGSRREGGTSFPASPSNNDIFFRTDRRLEYYYDSTVGQWLGTYRNYISLIPRVGVVRPLVSTTTYVCTLAGMEATYSVYIETLRSTNSVATTLDVSNNWTIQYKNDDSTGTRNNLGASFNSWQTGRVITNSYTDTVTVNAVYAPAALSLISFDATTTGSPGNLFYSNPIMIFRLVG